MNQLVSIPREALAELLQASGSSLTPEQYLASMPAVDNFGKQAWAIWISTCSRNLLIVAVIIGAFILLFDHDVESIIVFIGVATVTFFEYKVNRYFIEGNPKASSLGFRNQSFFAAGILIYCVYHGFFPQPIQLPDGMREYMDPSMADMMQGMTKMIYFVVGIIGGLSQFGLACYYWFARPKA